MTHTVSDRQSAALAAAEMAELSAGPRLRLGAAQVFQVFSHRYARDFAAALGICEDTVHDWGNAERERVGPHLQIVRLVRRALEEGMPPRRAHLLVDWIEAQLGRVGIAVGESDDAITARDLARGMHEFAQSVEGIAELVASGRGDRATVGKLRDEVADVATWARQMLAKLDAAAANGGKKEAA